MGPRVLCGVAAAATLLLIACGGQEPRTPTEPQFAKGGGSSGTACDFNSLNSLITGYFPSSQQSGILSLKGDFQNASDATTRRAIGFQIMDSIGKTSRTATLSASALTAGSDLSKGLIKCMFDASNTTEFPGFPNAAVYSFDLALDAPHGGAYFVRPEAVSSANQATPVIGTLDRTSASGNLSGIAPPAPPRSPITYNWRNTTSPPNARDGILDETVLIYGWRVSQPLEPLTYEWALIRPNALFNPYAVVAVCVGNAGPNTLVHESNIGFLAWQGGTASNEDASYICGQTQSLTMLENGWGPRALAWRLAQWGAHIMSPQPAFAAAVALNPGGGSGSATTLKSELTFDGVDPVSLSLVLAPNAVEHVNVPFTIQVRATDASGQGVNGICATLTGFNNNGQVAQLLGLSNCQNPTPGAKQLSRLTETIFVTDPVTHQQKPQAGYATFSVTVPSPGAMIISITGANPVNNNLTVQITGTTTGKFNVKP
jgi:hypothetical protein